jgi:hypothetical protein
MSARSPCSLAIALSASLATWPPRPLFRSGVRAPTVFGLDPPNADLSVLEGDSLQQIVVVLKDPVLEDGNLTYTVEVLEGDMPTSGNNVSVFIDVVGMPATPVSAAGVARRSYRRAVIY